MMPVYKCDYCNDMNSADIIIKHENQCEYNPNNKTCRTCAFSIIDTFTIKCDKHGNFIKPNWQAVCVTHCKEWLSGKPLVIFGG